MIVYLELMWRNMFCAVIGFWLYYGRFVIFRVPLVASVVITLTCSLRPTS